LNELTALDTHLPVEHAAPDYDQVGIIYIMSGFFEELWHRQVCRVALGCAVVAWLLIQMSAKVMPAYHARDWILPIFITVALSSKAHS
jgi:hypothetical protein